MWDLQKALRMYQMTYFVTLQIGLKPYACLVNANCFLEAKVHRNATASFGLFMLCQVFPEYSAPVVGTV